MKFSKTKALIRTNVKLTSNVKITVTSNDHIYLNSIESTQSVLSDFKYKNVKVSPNSRYAYDLSSFWNNGISNSDYIYKIKENDFNSLKNNFNDQYDTTYNAGCTLNLNSYYSEEFSYFAPLWVEDKIPDRFIILEVDEDKIKTPKDIITYGRIVANFDLTNKSNIGKYLSNHIDDTSFPDNSVFVDYNEDDYTEYRGVSIKQGGFVRAKELSKKRYITDTPLTYFEHEVVSGFERNNVVCANLLNLEFKFDTDSNSGIKRYVGFYVDDVDDKEVFVKSHKPNGKKFNYYTTTNPIYNLDYYKANDFLNYVKWDGNVAVNRMDLVQSSNEFVLQNITLPKKNTTPLFDTFHSYPVHNRGIQYVEIKFKKNAIDNNYIAVGSKDEDYIISATDTLPEGTANELYFSTQGSNLDCCIAFSKAVKNIGDKKLRTFINEDSVIVYVHSPVYEKKYSRLSHNLKIYDTHIQFPNGLNFVTPYKDLSRCVSVKMQYFPIVSHYKDNICVYDENGDRIGIKNLHKYFEYPTYSLSGEITGYKQIDDFFVIEFERPVTYITDINLYVDKVYTVGRFSFYDVEDLDLNLFGTDYGVNSWNEFYEKHFYTPTKSTVIDAINKKLKKIGITKKLKLNYIHAFDKLKEWYDGNLYTNHRTDFYNYANLLKTELQEHLYDLCGYIIDIPIIVNKEENKLIIDYKKLNSILSDDKQGVVEKTIRSEYDRLNENYTKEYSIVSRINPYIVKWVKDHDNVKGLPYRLNTNLAFGQTNFTPSFFEKNPTPEKYTHEWYYLGEYPGKSGLPLNGPLQESEINERYINSFFETNFDIDRYLSNETDYFTEYFTVEKVPYTRNNEIKYAHINPVERFSWFRTTNDFEFSETFFRGVKLYTKSLKSRSKINRNLSNLEYVYNNNFKDYKFSVILQPTYLEYEISHTDENEIKTIEIKNDGYKGENITYTVYKNEKYKNILLYITVKLPYISNYSDSKMVLDYNMLYNSKSLVIRNKKTNKYEYIPTPISGAIDLSSPIYDRTYKGITNILGTSTQLLSDIIPDSDGNYTDKILMVQIRPGHRADRIRYVIDKINTITDNNEITIDSIDQRHPPIVLSSEFYKRMVLFKDKGGENYLKRLFEKLSFAHIYEMFSQGLPEMQYVTIKESGELINEDTDFVLELEPPSYIDKNNNLQSVEDSNKPNSLVLSNDIIGYSFKKKDDATITPMMRYKGGYKPKFTSVLQFSDMGLKEKDKNMQLQFSFGEEFGKVKDYFYNRVSKQITKNVLTVNTKDYDPRYPLVNEVTIAKKDINWFDSRWSDEFHIETFNKNIQLPISGSYSVQDKPYVFASAYETTYDEIEFDDVTDFCTIKKNEKETQIYIDIDAMFVAHFLDSVKADIKKINDLQHIPFEDEDVYVKKYIESNIQPRFFLNELVFYVKSSTTKEDIPEIAVPVPGYEVRKDIQIKPDYTTRFNRTVINKLRLTNNFEYFAIKVKLSKHKTKEI